MMRDLQEAARRHRARFVLARRAVPPVGRVLLAARGPGIVHAGDRTMLSIQVQPSLTVTRAVQVVASAPVPFVPVVGAPLPQVIAAPVAPVARAAERPDTPVTTHRLERVLTSSEHRVTRSEERIPQVTRVVTHTVTTSAGPVVAEPPAGAARATVTTPATVPGTVQPPVLDLGRITDHVLTAMDDRLSAYAERLGRG